MDDGETEKAISEGTLLAFLDTRACKIPMVGSLPGQNFGVFNSVFNFGGSQKLALKVCCT